MKMFWHILILFHIIYALGAIAFAFLEKGKIILWVITCSITSILITYSTTKIIKKIEED